MSNKKLKELEERIERLEKKLMELRKDTINSFIASGLYILEKYKLNEKKSKEESKT